MDPPSSKSDQQGSLPTLSSRSNLVVIGGRIKIKETRDPLSKQC
jgi:hypothetical protein